MRQEVVALILAAGASTRMGSPKALLPWGKSTVLEHILSQVQKGDLENSVLVTGAHHNDLLNVIRDTPVQACYHPGWEQGMGSSLARGIQCVEEQFPKAGAILVLLSDQPFVTGPYLRQMCRAHEASPSVMIASRYGDAPGVPALFPKEFWKALKALPPGQGAKAFILEHREQCQALEAGFPLMDIDTPETYQRALAMARNPSSQKRSK